MNGNGKDDKLSASFADATREHTIMSLSTIAQTLQDIDNGTPRRLVDQLLMAKKQKKKSAAKQLENLTSNTYTLPISSRCSLPVCSSNSSKQVSHESSALSRNLKLSLDSKTTSDSSALKYQNTTRDSLPSTEVGDVTNSEVNSSLAEILGGKLKIRENSTVNISNSYTKNTGTLSMYNRCNIGQVYIRTTVSQFI